MYPTEILKTMNSTRIQDGTRIGKEFFSFESLFRPESLWSFEYYVPIFRSADLIPNFSSTSSKPNRRTAVKAWGEFG